METTTSCNAPVLITPRKVGLEGGKEDNNIAAVENMENDEGNQDRGREE